MIHNDVLRSVRYMLALNEQKMVEIFKLANFAAKPWEITAFMKKEEEDGFIHCPDIVMGNFLNGLIYLKRGKDESRPAPEVTIPVTNNTVLKKLRVAFELKDTDMHDIFASVGFPISKPELSAFFRAEGTSNYRNCEDQYLRNFLKGLTMRIRK
jgi:uncharacterized protein YehS (DUF1456 family)